jgi:DNA primase
VLDRAHAPGVGEGSALREALASGELGASLRRVEAALTHASDWPSRPGAAADDVAAWWSHIVSLHRKTRSLNRELKEAEEALGAELSDANLAWLRDVQQRLAVLEGTEALIEGFGASSGRPVRGL